MIQRLFKRTLGNYTLPDISHNVLPIKSPSPYFRLHVIKSNPSIKRSLLDTLNSKPYRFNFTQEQLIELLQRSLVNVWVPTMRVRASIPYKNTIMLDKLIKKPLDPYSIITYNQHIHETPVPTPENLQILSPSDDELVAIDKPAGVPVHGVQKYYLNTVQSMLANQLGCEQSDLYPLHRLDKLTSGVLLWTFNAETVAKFKCKDAWNRSKTYLARIRGRLPLQTIICTDDLVYLYPTRQMVRVYTGANTHFEEIFYDNSRDESLVSAKLGTGFPHQIRIHLRNMGSPIVDDPLYGKNGKYREVKKQKKDITDAYWDEILQRSKNIRDKKLSEKSGTCSICDAPEYHVLDRTSAENHAICLHAWIYQYEGVAGGPYADQKITYEAPIPGWAIPDGVERAEAEKITKQKLAESSAQKIPCSTYS